MRSSSLKSNPQARTHTYTRPHPYAIGSVSLTDTGLANTGRYHQSRYRYLTEGGRVLGGREGGKVSSEGISEQHTHPGLRPVSRALRGGEPWGVGLRREGRGASSTWRVGGGEGTQRSPEVHADCPHPAHNTPGMRTKQEWGADWLEPVRHAFLEDLLCAGASVEISPFACAGLFLAAGVAGNGCEHCAELPLSAQQTPQRRAPRLPPHFGCF